jgi:hypothetical protein
MTYLLIDQINETNLFIILFKNFRLKFGDFLK